MNYYPDIDAAEAELQQELREMFAVDTQQHLETYFGTIQQLNPQSWTADIQNLYRAIHTVKGGAVTVAADAMLHAAMVLEDLLSDLRYLEVAPNLADKALERILLEAGELLGSSMEIMESGDLAIELVQPTVNRLKQLHERVKQLYLPEWNELQQVHQEFAEQGFDLVILDLEMKLTKIPSTGIVPQPTIEIARSTMNQLSQIGIDLELSEDWTILLQDCEELIAKPDCQLWTLAWFEYFQLLKTCARNGGKFTNLETEGLDRLTILVRSIAESVEVPTASETEPIDRELLSSIDDFFVDEPMSSIDDNLLGSIDNFFGDEEIAAPTISEPENVAIDLVGSFESFFMDEEIASGSNIADSVTSELNISSEFSDELLDIGAVDAIDDRMSVAELDNVVAIFDNTNEDELQQSALLASLSSDLLDVFGNLDDRSNAEVVGANETELEQPEEAPQAAEILSSIDNLFAAVEFTEELPNAANSSLDLESDAAVVPIQSELALTELSELSSVELENFADFVSLNSEDFIAEIENEIVYTDELVTETKDIYSQYETLDLEGTYDRESISLVANLPINDEDTYSPYETLDLEGTYDRESISLVANLPINDEDTSDRDGILSIEDIYAQSSLDLEPVKHIDNETTYAQDGILSIEDIYAQASLDLEPVTQLDEEATCAQDATLSIDDTYAQESLDLETVKQVDDETTYAQDGILSIEDIYAQESLDLEPVIQVDDETTYAQDATLSIDDTYAQESLDLDTISGIDAEATYSQNATLVIDDTYTQESLDLDAISSIDAEGTYSQDATLVIEDTYTQESLENEITIDRESPEIAIEIDRQPELPVIAEPATPPAIIPEKARVTAPANPSKRNIQIPVPLERLDKSAQQVVDSLLTARAVMNISSHLQSQLHRLTMLTRENSQFVTRLRQLQDDYALLRNLSDDKQDSENNVTLERYRQGYTTINRLLENILRLSELGQEIESSTYQNAIRLEALDRSILQLKDGIEISRLVPFRNLTLRSKAILRDLTNRYGKPAELIVENEQIEIDAGVIQQLEPALLHLLRNAYDHGLESVDRRLATDKPMQGQIRISLQNQGNLYRLTIEDDGGGIDADRIHQLALAKGFENVRTNTNAELLAVLCQPGFSSSDSVSEVSGRGVGMDVVLSQITGLGGKLSLETRLGVGTKFTIEVPAPQLLIPCVLFQVGDRIVALPTHTVLETALVSSMTASSNADDSLCTWTLTNTRGEIPGYDLNDYWQPSNATQPSQRSLPDTAICIRTRQEEGTPTIWSIADDLVGQAKLLISPLPSPLIAPVGLLGVSLQPDGRLISILDPIALTADIATTSLLSASNDTAVLATPDRDRTPSKPSAPTILIVDDAAMIRRRLEASLNTYGFITHTCNDGLEALNWLQTNPHPDLMITDVEMPNMDGFTLIDRARQSEIDIPILVVSSRLSAEWGKEARRLGATDYLNKGFSTSELLQKVNLLLGLVVSG